MKKIPRKYSGLAMGILMAIVMAPIMSFVITFLNVGFGDDFLHRWMLGLLGALPIAVPTSLIVTPIVKGLVDKISE